MEHNTYEDLFKQETEVTNKTKEESPEIGWYKHFYEDMQKIILIMPHIREKNELPENPAVYYLLMTSTLKIIHTSKSIIHLISRGYYGQGMILLRSIQEEYQHMLFYYYATPNQIKQWNAGRIKSKHIQKYMLKAEWIPKKWKGLAIGHIKFYDMLSKFVHPSRLGWIGVVQIDEDTGNNLLKFLPVYEKKFFNYIFTALMSFCSNTILFLLTVYEHELKTSKNYNDIMQHLKECESEYMKPTIQNMSLYVDSK